MWKNLPNLLTMMRLLIVPLTIWSLISGAYMTAFLSFILAGLSDGLDGYIARRFNLRSELGANLDPLADKVLLVSIYVALAVLQVIPTWLALVVVTRDVLIVGGVMLSRLLNKPLQIQPVLISKANTVAQILLAASMLASLAFSIHNATALLVASISVALLTLASLVVYMRNWLHHMTSNGQGT
jgi:cardiolipin synthase (CMP-forming)